MGSVRLRMRRNILIAPLAAAALAACGSGHAAPAGAATVSMSPTAPQRGDAVLLRGSGFVARRAVLVRLGPAIVARATTDFAGRFVAAFTVGPAAALRPATVSTYSAGRRTFGTLRVLATRGADAGETSTSLGQHLTVSGLGGTRLRIAARGLPRHAFVRSLIGTTSVATGNTGAAGSLFRVISAPASPIGRRPVLVHAGATFLRGYFDVHPPGLAAPRPVGSPVVTLAAAGDIACPPGRLRGAVVCRQGDTANLLEQLAPDAVVSLGDTQYNRGLLGEFAGSYDPTWGRLKTRTRPAVGNHEYYLNPGAAGYFSYFGAAAGARGRGYYSYDLGAWHVIALNANCAIVSCAAGSVQERWLRADLAAHSAACTLAYWHQPRFSSGFHGNNVNTFPLFQALYGGGADLVLNGHDHDYERWAPQDAAGNRDDARGISEIVVGTGGEDQRSFTTPQPANSVVRVAPAFGVLSLTLRQGAYDWRFVPAPGTTLADSGSANCH
jgi:hypothetical protein